MTNATTIIQTRVPASDKKAADSICQQLGLSLNDALRMFVKAVVNTQSIPLNLTTTQTRQPDAQELQAIEEFMHNASIATTQEVQATEKELGIRLTH